MGLDTLADDLNVMLNNGSLSFKLDVPSVTLRGDYDVDLNITLPEQEHVNAVGTGKFTFTLVNGTAFIALRLRAPPFGFIGLDYFDILLDFESLTGYAENLKLNDELVDWEELSDNAKPIFESIWNSVKDPLIQDVFKLVDSIVGVIIISVHTLRTTSMYY